jgi:hypothetical protein
VDGRGRGMSERRTTPVCRGPEGGAPSPSAMGSGGYSRHDNGAPTEARAEEVSGG